MTYEYICTACAHEWEASQSISEPALKKCPKCKRATAKRQVSGGTGFVLKGGGWYADLYSSAGASKKKEKADEKGTSESSADAAPSKAETGSKTDSKKETKKADVSKPSPSKASAD